MTALRFLLIAAIAALSPLAAQAATKKSSPDPSKFAVFCPGPYALCIKAACEPTTKGKGRAETVVCSCEVQHGWSMGPAQCTDRMPVVQNGQMQIMSTYSNAFNSLENQNMTCKGGQKQAWANCYGATCTVDPLDPNRARCTCPVRHGDMVTLGGDCNKNNCSKMWSAARPAENAFANNHYWKWMTDHGYPTNPPAKVCGAI
ncbi:MAG: hypothetical protein ACTHLO_14030 [Pseudolabrys sp.]